MPSFVRRKLPFSFCRLESPLAFHHFELLTVKQPNELNIKAYGYCNNSTSELSTLKMGFSLNDAIRGVSTNMFCHDRVLLPLYMTWDRYRKVKM